MVRYTRPTNEEIGYLLYKWFDSFTSEEAGYIFTDILGALLYGSVSKNN